MDPMQTIAADMVAAAFPELDDHQGIVSFLDELGFKCAGKSFSPSAQSKHIDSLVSGMFMASEAKTAHLLLNKITDDNTYGGMRRTRLAVLKISAGSLDALEEAVKRALDDDRDVMVNAETRQRNLGKVRPLAPGVTDRSMQKFREYVLWLMRYLQPEIYASCGSVGTSIDKT
jgi:hypothetical protein